MDKNLKDVFLSPSHNWGNTIDIFNGSTFYFQRHDIMSGHKLNVENDKVFKVIYIQKGLGTIKVDSKLKSSAEKLDIEEGLSFNVLPFDKYEIECFQDATIFEVGTCN